MSQCYKLNRDKKTIIIDDSVKQSKADQKDIQLYVLAGYEIKHKSKAKSKQATKRADTITAEEIRKELSADSEALDTFNNLISEKGYFTARKFYRDYKATSAPEASAIKPRTKRGRKPKEDTTQAPEAVTVKEDNEE